MNRASNHNKKILIMIGISGMLAVVLGAFGAHALVNKISAESLSSYKTGVSYQFYHTLAALLCYMLLKDSDMKSHMWPTISFLIGNLLFSGSIYLLTTRMLTGLDNISWLGPITPIGGFFYIFGWIMMIYIIYKDKK